jgi:folate-binding protein YgfZ
MVTQELKDLAPGTARQAFWLSRKGRIEADLLLIELGEALWIDLDLHQAASTALSLREFLFAEDIDIQEVSAEFHHIGIHGKLADDVLGAAADQPGFALQPLSAASLTIDNAPCIVVRRDQTGEKGYELIVPRDRAAGVWEFLVAADHVVGQDRRRVRPIGWHAFNIARVEAGTPLFNIDFGPTNLPHETGVLQERVSFTKGCYLGQEIVARMENLGQPKQKLVGLRVQDDVLPVAESHVYDRTEGGMGSPVGTITSSTLSPMLGAAPIAFAMIKTAAAAPGQRVIVAADNQQAEAIIGPLRFWPQA